MKKAIELLKQGKVIIYPTETSYSFGCDPRNKAAVEKIHELKKEKTKPIMLIISNLKQIEEFGILNETANKLAKFMPCPLNLIIEKKENYPHLSKDGIAFRISSNKIANQLAEAFGPITTTSVNIHGNPPIYNIDETKQFNIYTIDTGNLEKNPVSTIYDTRTNKTLREGPIKI